MIDRANRLLQQNLASKEPLSFKVEIPSEHDQGDGLLARIQYCVGGKIMRIRIFPREKTIATIWKTDGRARLEWNDPRDPDVDQSGAFVDLILGVIDRPWCRPVSTNANVYF